MINAYNELVFRMFVKICHFYYFFNSLLIRLLAHSQPLSVLQSMSSSLVENLGLEAKRHLNEAVAERVKTIEEGRNRFSRNYRQSSRQYATPLAPPVSASKYARTQAVA